MGWMELETFALHLNQDRGWDLLHPIVLGSVPGPVLWLIHTAQNWDWDREQDKSQNHSSRTVAKVTWRRAVQDIKSCQSYLSHYKCNMDTNPSACQGPGTVARKSGVKMILLELKPKWLEEKLSTPSKNRHVLPQHNMFLFRTTCSQREIKFEKLENKISTHWNIMWKQSCTRVWRCCNWTFLCCSICELIIWN